MNLGQSIRTGVKWLVVGSTGGQILQFVFGIVLARLLVPADFGMIATIQVFTGFVGMLASGGMGQSLIRTKEVDTNDFNAVFTMQLMISTLIYAGFFVAAPWIAGYFDNPLYTDLLRVSALSFIMRPSMFVRLAWLNREMNFKSRLQVDLVVALVVGIASIAMASGGWGVWSLTVSGLLGALVANVLFARVTPLRPRLFMDRHTIRKHAAYGLKVTASEMLKNLKEQAINLILSKVAGPGFLGLFNKAESLARMPNRLITPPTSQAVFRAMSKVQDDLNQTKYMFHRTITLLLVYIIPLLIGLWWVAEPFVGLVYGEKWLPMVEPLRIIILAGAFRTVFISGSLVLAAQNRMTQEVIAEAVSLVVSVAACVYGLKWGLAGVAWALVASTVFYTVYIYVLVYRTLPIRVADLFRAMAPALLLNSLLAVVLTVVHFSLGVLGRVSPVYYLAAMVASGGIVYAAAFLYLPIPALRAEAARWRENIGGLLSLASKPFR